MSNIIEKTAATLVKAGSTFRPDQIAAYLRAIENEKNNMCKWVLTQILDNAKVAAKNHGPLCDDTGIPHLILEVGPGVSLSGQIINDIHEGVRQGLRQLPGRPMAIKGDDYARLDQSGGLDNDPAALKPAPLLVVPTDEDVLRLYVLMLGGGPAIRGVTQRVFHRHSVDTIIDEIVQRATEGVRKLGCSPCTLAVGIGRSQYEATSMMMLAMAKGDYGVQSEFEKTITDRVNANNIGPLGLGKGVSVMGTFARIGPQRASGVRIVALRPCCCFEPRVACVEL